MKEKLEGFYNAGLDASEVKKELEKVSYTQELKEFLLNQYIELVKSKLDFILEF